MNGNENIKIGDKLICISNTGLSVFGSIKTIWGLSEKSINFQKCDTSWQSRNDVRWECFKHESCEPTEEILEYQKVFKEVEENNKIILQKRYASNGLL